MIDSIKNNFFLYLLFLTPFMLIPGIAVIELSVLFLTLFFFYKNRDIDYFKDFKFLFLILFSFYVAVNAFFQIDDNLRFSSYIFFRFCLLSLSIYFILNFYKDTSDKDKKNILLLILGLSTLIFIDSYLQFLSGKNIFGIEIIDGKMRFYGMSSESAMSRHNVPNREYRGVEGKTVEVPHKGPVKNTLIDILSGIRSACTYIGATRLKALSKCATFVRVNNTHNTIFGEEK